MRPTPSEQSGHWRGGASQFGRRWIVNAARPRRELWLPVDTLPVMRDAVRHLEPLVQRGC